MVSPRTPVQLSHLSPPSVILNSPPLLVKQLGPAQSGSGCHIQDGRGLGINREGENGGIHRGLAPTATPIVTLHEVAAQTHHLITRVKEVGSHIENGRGPGIEY